MHCFARTNTLPNDVLFKIIWLLLRTAFKQPYFFVMKCTTTINPFLTQTHITHASALAYSSKV
jgi:hypothetical protein